MLGGLHTRQGEGGHWCQWRHLSVSVAAPHNLVTLVTVNIAHLLALVINLIRDISELIML